MNSVPGVSDRKKPNDYGQNGEYENYEIESAARTIREAEEIKADAKKMKYVSKCLEKDMKAMKKAVSSISDLRERRMELAEDED